MPEFDGLSIWQEPEISDRLTWYLQVASNRMPAKFRLARHIPVAVSLTDTSEAALWEELKEKTGDFLELWMGVRRGEAALESTAPNGPHLMDLCLELSRRMLRHCNFCRWNCQVDRSLGDKFGTCKLAADTRVSSYFHHQGEELIYRGTEGSGTLFFTSCNMRCAFCQNGDISTDKDNGISVSARSLAAMAWLLRMEGCHNINWVGGEVTIHLHTIVEAISQLDRIHPTREELAAVSSIKGDYFLRSARLQPERAQYENVFNAPMLWNSNFFMTEASMQILRLLMDVWLPDLKFGPGRCSVTLARTPWYWETVTQNIQTIYDWGEDFTIRHLVMPNHVECCTRPILEWVAQQMPDVQVNIMDQFHPDNFCDPRGGKFDEKYQEISRRPTTAEIRQAFGYAAEFGVRFKALSYEKNTTGIRL